MDDDDLEAAIQEILDDNRIPAKQAWEILSMMAATALDAMQSEEE